MTGVATRQTWDDDQSPTYTPTSELFFTVGTGQRGMQMSSFHLFFVADGSRMDEAINWHCDSILIVYSLSARRIWSLRG